MPMAVCRMKADALRKRRIYANLSITLSESGSSLERIIKQNIYLTVSLCRII